MDTFDREKLRSIKTFFSLIDYLRDELDWPIESESFEDLTFEYDSEELGIELKNAAKIINPIKQLRPLITNQSWGIFFIQFEPKRLPVVALRRILRSLVFKKRTSANQAEIASWGLSDLLFISAYGEDTERQITFAHFAESPEFGDLPTLRVLGWDDEDTALHLDHVYKELHEKLCWPEDETNQDKWREQWSSAFTLRHREVINTSKQMAIRLADLARIIRKRVNAILKIESERGPIRKLMQAFKEALIHDLTDDDFADMYAQTIAYGLLTARISRPAGLVADDIKEMVPITNPFLKELLETFLNIGGRKNLIDFDELGINDIVELLRSEQVNMEAVLRDFGNLNQDEDPVIHFYELFLKEYDAQKRIKRGVFFTPKSVVSFIVRSVDEILRTEFGLMEGLADTTTWGEMVQRNPNLRLPKKKVEIKDAKGWRDVEVEIDPTSPFVQVLDPSTGTGTFLVEVIDLIYKTMTEKWRTEGHDLQKIEQLWNDYVPENLLPRLHGYELMMAPYAIAHMKIGLKLFETGYRFGSEERARVYLTNSLEPVQDFSGTMAFAIPALAHEAEVVNQIKRNHRFTIVIGNPPYSVSSWNTGDWITEISEDYKRTVRSEESQIQSLSNDYIKFLRFAEWLIEVSGAGILGFITGHGYLHGTQPRDLRRHLTSTFDTCYCLDLHGSIRRVGPGDADDEPVFLIMTGVAVLVGVRRSPSEDSHGVALQYSVTGPLAKKWRILLDNTILSATKNIPAYQPTGPHFFFCAPVADKGITTEYDGYTDLPAIFGTGNRQEDKEKFWATGFATQQDDLAISITPEEVEHKMKALADSISFDELRQQYRLCTTNQWNYEEAKKFARSGEWREYLVQVNYRPFDRRWTVMHKHVLTILRKRVMSQLIGDSSENIGLVSSRAVNDHTFAHSFVTNEPVDKISISSKTSTNAYVFPLYMKHSGLLEDGCRRSNLCTDFVALLTNRLGVELHGNSDPSSELTPETIFNYIYAVLHSPYYRKRYADFLKIDFPRIPLTGNIELFRALAALGMDLVSLHLMESPNLNYCNTTVEGMVLGYSIDKVSFSDKTVWIDKTNARGFRGVPEELWNFHIGGYQVCEKWLKDRGPKKGNPGRILTAEDIDHYQKIVVALSETIRIMKEIDEVIEKYGGWPGAFLTNSKDKN